MYAAVPDKYRKDVENLDKKKLNALLLRVAKEDPDKYVDILQNIGKISADAVTYYGREGSIALSDFKLNDSLRKLREQNKAHIQSIIDDDTKSDDWKKQAIVKYTMSHMSKVKDELGKMSPKGNALITQLTTGAKGNPSQIMQLMYGDMIVVDNNGSPIPIAGLVGYGEGAGAKEYWAGSYGSRMGYASVQFGTADSGYLGKLLTQAAHRVVVTEEDCGASDTGVKRKGDDPHNIGAVLIRPVAGLEAGHAITKKDLAKLHGKDVYIRSAMTCQAEEGVCSKCAGKEADGEFPAVGTAIGVTAARAIAEPTTQLALSVKHSGGVAGEDEEKVSGFKAVSQFVNVPSSFIGGSVLADQPGTVSKIEDAPQGGYYVSVGKAPHYVPNGVKLTVKEGDRVEAGDMLSEGVPNPAQIVKYKGIGEGRRYFADKFADILEKNGVGNHKRNVEALARGLINRVKITDPKGFQGYYMEETVPYDSIAREYKPRAGFSVKTPVAAKGMYLEKPALHYTIGTRITGTMAKDLSNAGIQSIVVHKDKPPFDPVMSRIMESSSTDPDWKVRLGGFNLQRSFLDAATRGSRSREGDTSYIPSVIEGKDIFSDYTKAGVKDNV